MWDFCHSRFKLAKILKSSFDLIPLPSGGKESKKANEWINHLKKIQALVLANLWASYDKYNTSKKLTLSHRYCGSATTIFCHGLSRGQVATALQAVAKFNDKNSSCLQWQLLKFTFFKKT